MREELLMRLVEREESCRPHNADKDSKLNDVIADVQDISAEVTMMARLVYVFGLSKSSLAKELGISSTAVSAKLRPVTEKIMPTKQRVQVRMLLARAFPQLSDDEMSFAVKRVHNLKNHRYDASRSLSSDEAIAQVTTEISEAKALGRPYLGAPGVGVTSAGKGTVYTVNGLSGTPSQLLRAVTELPPSSDEYKRLYRQIYNLAQKMDMKEAVNQVIGKFISEK